MIMMGTYAQTLLQDGIRTRNDAPECASMDTRHSFQATIVRCRHTFFNTATDALIASASSMLATFSPHSTQPRNAHCLDAKHAVYANMTACPCAREL